MQRCAIAELNIIIYEILNKLLYYYVTKIHPKKIKKMYNTSVNLSIQIENCLEMWKGRNLIAAF